jgi:PAS domain S-box-containing protein
VYKGVKSGLVAASGDVRQISRDLISSTLSASYTELLLTDTGGELPGMGSPIHVDEHVLGALVKLPEGVLSALDDVTVDKVAIGDHLAVRIRIADTGLSLVTVLTREAAYGQISSPFFLYSASAFPLILLIAAVLFERVRRVGWALVQSEQRFRTIFDNVRDVIFIFDVASLTIIEANPRVLGLYGYEPDEVVGLTMEDISEPGQSGPHQLWSEYVAEATSGTPQLFTWLARRKSAESFWVEITIVRAAIGRHDRLLVVSHDITQLKSHEQALVEALEHQKNLNCQLEDAQSQLLQSEKMASIGQLAAGIAHEINNPIGYVNSNMVTLSGYVENLLKMLAAYQQDEDGVSPERRAELVKLREVLDIAYLSEDVGALLQESLGGLQRVRKIVTDLRDFSHVDEKQFERANLERGLDSTLNVVWNELKYKADVVKEYAGVPEVECLPSQLNQVFMNLLVNAVQSIAEHGRITVRTAFDEKNVWVEIQDTGSGISPEHMSKIFEPFFTTKPVGKGTGLGLSLAYGIVKKHSGRIEVNSDKGAGSQFRIVLPRSRPAQAAG